MSNLRRSPADVLRVLKAVVAEDPGRRDTYIQDGHHNARYVVDGAPNCLVAVALHRMGASLGVLRQLDREVHGRGGTNTGVLLGATRHLFRLRFTPAAWELLASVQRHQDAGMKWADAVAQSVAPTISWLDQRRYGWTYQQETRPWMPLPTDTQPSSLNS